MSSPANNQQLTLDFIKNAYKKLTMKLYKQGLKYYRKEMKEKIKWIDEDEMKIFITDEKPIIKPILKPLIPKKSVRRAKVFKNKDTGMSVNNKINGQEKNSENIQFAGKNNLQVEPCESLDSSSITQANGNFTGKKENNHYKNIVPDFNFINKISKPTEATFIIKDGVFKENSGEIYIFYDHNNNKL